MALSREEKSLAHLVGFDESICDILKAQSSAQLERLMGIDEQWKPTPADGISISVKDGHEAETLIKAIQTPLRAQGYRAFWSERHAPNGGRETHEVAILKTSDEFAMIRLRRSDGGNYDVSTEDIIDRLTDWQQMCTFDVVGASRDWVALVFSKFPEKICAFAEEVYSFCPDSVDQGVGLPRESDKPEKFAAARKFCPEISPKIAQRQDEMLAELGALNPELLAQARELMASVGDGFSTPPEMGVRLLAHELATTKYLFLWWD